MTDKPAVFIISTCFDSLKRAQPLLGSFGMSLTNKKHGPQDWHAALRDQTKVSRQRKSSGKGVTQEMRSKR